MTALLAVIYTLLAVPLLYSLWRLISAARNWQTMSEEEVRGGLAIPFVYGVAALAGCILVWAKG